MTCSTILGGGGGVGVRCTPPRGSDVRLLQAETRLCGWVVLVGDVATRVDRRRVRDRPTDGRPGLDRARRGSDGRAASERPREGQRVGGRGWRQATRGTGVRPAGPSRGASIEGSGPDFDSSPFPQRVRVQFAAESPGLLH
jgi:hypothetical protein